MNREPRWVAPFLKQLERTGNVRMAAERAGVDFSTAYQRRKRHAEFAERWEVSLAAHKASPPQSPLTLPSLRDGSLPLPQGERGSLAGGAELTLRPDSHGGGALVKAPPAASARWGKRAEERFLAALAETANVRKAAEAAGVSTQAVYARRLKQTDFAEAWELALDTGKARLESMLIEAAQRRFDPDELPLSESEPQVSVSEALHIVKLKRTEPGRGPAAGGWKPYVATPEEVERSLIKRLKIFAKRVEKVDIANGWSIVDGRSIPPGWVRIEDARCADCGAEISERLEGPSCE